VLFHLICFGWLLFRAESVTQVGVMLLACVTEISTRLSDTVWPPPCGPRAQISTFSAIGFCAVCAALLVVQLKQLAVGRLEFVPSLGTGTRAGLYVVAIIAFLWFGSTNGAAFIYFAF
jgi:alginate O-acetyltransferase complex protein AlgI